MYEETDDTVLVSVPPGIKRRLAPAQEGGDGEILTCGSNLLNESWRAGISTHATMQATLRNCTLWCLASRRSLSGLCVSMLVVPGLLGCTTEATKERIVKDRQAEQATEQCLPVTLWDTHGDLSDETNWTPVKSLIDVPSVSVRDLVIDNGIARVTYEPVAEQQQGGHSLYVRPAPGHEWSRVTHPFYGDYMYWVSPITEPAYSVQVTALSDERVELAFDFHHAPIFMNAPEVKIRKRVAVQSCHSGMFVGIETDPVNVEGERELGGLLSRVSFSPVAAALHPEDNAAVNMGIAASDSHWAATVGYDDLLRVLALPRGMPTYSYQFDPSHPGILNVWKFFEQSPPVKNERYQIFIGGVQYDGSQVIVEAESCLWCGHYREGEDASEGAYVQLDSGWEINPEISVSEAGTYSIWLRSKTEEIIGTEISVALDGAEPIVVMGHPSSNFSLSHIGDIQVEAGSHELNLSVLSGKLAADALLFVPSQRAGELADRAVSAMSDH